METNFFNLLKLTKMSNKQKKSIVKNLANILYFKNIESVLSQKETKQLLQLTKRLVLIIED